MRKKKKKNKKKYKKKIINNNNNNNNNNNKEGEEDGRNPFFDIQYLKNRKNEKIIKILKDINIFEKLSINTFYEELEYPFWLPEDELYFFGESILTIKNRILSLFNPNDPFLILQKKEDFLSIHKKNMFIIKNKICDIMKNHKKIKNKDFIPINPIKQYKEYKNEDISSEEKFFLNVMKYCALGHEHDPDEGITKIFPDNEFFFNIYKDKFDYKIDFDRINENYIL